MHRWVSYQEKGGEPPFSFGVSQDQAWLVALAMCLGAFATYLIYLPGLTGPFLLDDFHNLEPLAYGGGIVSWDAAQAFIFGREGLVAGRPVSMATFLLDDFTWPAPSWRFKHTSLLFHCLTGFFIFLLVRKLLVGEMGFQKKQGTWLAVFVQCLWLVHPLQVSTVLYVIQRMTILAALFSAAAFWIYLIIRERVSSRHYVPAIGLSVIFVVVCILGVLAKQNAIIVVGFVVVCELFLLKSFLSVDVLSSLRRWFLFCCSVAPIAALAVNDNWSEIYANREFTLRQRLVLQGAILGDYIGKIVFPTVERLNIFDERFVPSSISWNNGDFISGYVVIGFAVLLWCLASYKKQKLIVFGFAWFFFFHSIESTVIPLELYFEHRNYLPLLGLVLVVIEVGRVFIRRIESSFVAGFLTVAVLVYFGFCTVLMTNTWASPVALYVKLTGDEPKSVRAKLAYSAALEYQGLSLLALAELREAARIKPENIGILLGMIRLACENDLELERGEIDALMERAARFDTHALSSLKGLIELDSKKDVDCEWMGDHFSLRNIFEMLPTLNGFSLIGNAKAQFWDLRAKYYTGQLDFPEVMYSLDQAIASTPNVVDLYIKKIVYLYSAELYELALETVPEAIDADNRRPRFALSRLDEIQFLRANILAHLEKSSSEKY